MSKAQNIYDNEVFFNEYQNMRANCNSANELLEIPTIKKMLPDFKGKKVLDLGCGAGGMSRFFADNGAKKVVAVDVSENMIEAARKEASHENIEYVRMAMEDLLNLSEKFDLVFSSLAFHYVEDFEKLMSDISSLLLDGGELVFSQEHPIVTSVVLDKGMENRIQLNGKRYYLVSDYNDNSKRVMHWNVDGVVKFHRNFSTILNSIILAGMKIVEVQESQPLSEAVKKVDKFKYQKDKPYYLFVRAQKI
ncbi:MAG: class I SAM-dependent methyltransferase [Clostridia bacterium]|nr:class I SAM-dependent methyltransferase [Clostridia bacterium]